MDHGKALCTHHLLALLTKDCGTNLGTLVAQRRHANLRSSVLTPVPIEVTFPKALNAVVVQTIVAGKGGGIVPTLFTFFLRLDYLTIGNIDKHRLMLETVAPAVHVLEALEAEVIFTIGTEDLRLFD